MPNAVKGSMALGAIMSFGLSLIVLGQGYNVATAVGAMFLSWPVFTWISCKLP